MVPDRGYRVRLDRAADVEDVLVPDQLRELRRDLTDRRLRGPVEDEPEGALIGVLDDQDHGPVEVVGHARRGDQELARESFAHATKSDWCPRPAGIRLGRWGSRCTGFRHPTPRTQPG